eukprot:scaffold66269_cov55-Phaeocystis_antarctica.AAC.2
MMVQWCDGPMRDGPTRKRDKKTSRSVTFKKSTLQAVRSCRCKRAGNLRRAPRPLPRAAGVGGQPETVDAP